MTGHRYGEAGYDLANNFCLSGYVLQKGIRSYKVTTMLHFLYTKDHRGVDLISDVLPFGRLWYGRCEPPLLNLVVSPTTTVEQ
jgi:hypothetical protein